MAKNEDGADHVLVRAVRPFEGAEGHKDESSQPFRVHRRRAAELKANGLIEHHDESEAKAAPVPQNKMAAEPANKAAPAVTGRRARD